MDKNNHLNLCKARLDEYRTNNPENEEVKLFLVYKVTYNYTHGVAHSTSESLYGIYFDKENAEKHAEKLEDYCSWGEIRTVIANKPIQ